MASGSSDFMNKFSPVDQCSHPLACKAIKEQLQKSDSGALSNAASHISTFWNYCITDQRVQWLQNEVSDTFWISQATSCEIQSNWHTLLSLLHASWRFHTTGSTSMLYLLMKESWCALILNEKHLVGHTLKLLVDDVELGLCEDKDVTFHIP